MEKLDSIHQTMSPINGKKTNSITLSSLSYDISSKDLNDDDKSLNELDVQVKEPQFILETP